MLETVAMSLFAFAVQDGALPSLVRETIAVVMYITYALL